jgi:GT2 family glycosyltransferase
MSTAVGVAFLLLGIVPALLAGYQLVLAVAAFFHRPPAPSDARPHTSVVVLVPAHDEAALIARCVASLLAQTYPARLCSVVVVADNCTDDTAALARSAGAEVLVRDAPDRRGKGHALRWAIERICAGERPPDALVVVDADSFAAPEFLATLVDRFERGAVCVQGESLLAEDGSPATALRAAAFLLVNRVRPSGRAVLGLPSNLSGNGMLFGRELLEAHPWDAFTSTEDVEYWIRLRTAGVEPAFARGAILLSPAAPTAEAASEQQLRWEGGKLHLARTRVPGLLAEALRRRRLSLLDTALELALPPLGVLAAAAIAGTVVGAALAVAGALPSWSLVPWAAALVSIALYVLVGLRAGRAPASAYRALAGAPWLVARKALRIRRLLSFHGDTWVRTQRAAPVEVANGDRDTGGDG